MAASAPSDKVKDKEYKNWLKLTLALYYLKSGLHTFIQSEVDNLHQLLVKNIYGSQNVPRSPCTVCHASFVKRNKYTGVWEFQKQCSSTCNIWLDELLKYHTDPKSENIYWDNSDVHLWPFRPWECAKVFMPRGQKTCSAEPVKSDTRALLTLLVNCKHFHDKLSKQGLRLLYKISTIQNELMHNGEMKVSDADRMSSIQQIIQLLEDPVCLKSLEECNAAVRNIHKIDNDSTDVFFNLGQEMTALRAAVTELREGFGMQENFFSENDNSVKEEGTTKGFEDVKNRLELHEQRVDDNVKLQEEEVNIGLHRVRLGEVEEIVEMHRKRPGAVEDSVEMHGERLGTVEDNVELHGERLGTFEENVEFHGERLGTVEENVKLYGVRLRAVEQTLAKLQEEIRQMERKNNSHIQVSEALTKRKPESDGLKHLKCQTEDMLDTVRRLGCIPTTQAAEAKKLLEEKRSVVIKGNPGEGKTTIAFDLIDNEMYRDRRVVVYCPRDWKTVDTDWVDIVVLEDILGKYDFDPSCLQEWMVYLPTIQEHVDSGKLQVIITTRVDILTKADSKLGSLKLFSDHLSLTLSSEQLSNSEKMSILNRELKRHKKNMKEDELEKCITNFSGLIGFPQCCSLFAGDNRLFDSGPEFFRFPKKFLVASISELKSTIFLSLAFLFCNGKIYEENLSPETMPAFSRCLLMELTSHLRISNKEASITLLRDAYTSCLELYLVKKDMSNDLSLGISFKKPSIWFTCSAVYEAVGRVLGDKCADVIVKYGDSKYLYQRTYTAETKDSSSQDVFLPVYVYRLLAERMVRDVAEKGLVGSVVKHSALRQHTFLMKLKLELHRGNRIKEFFMAVASNMSRFDQSLSEEECITFMQYIVKSDEYLVRLVYSQFLEFLACVHNDNSPDCWQCEEKQKLLELSLYYHHFHITEKLIAMNACYTNVSLCNAARHGNVRRVKTILDKNLKRRQVFNPECIEAKEALCRAYLSESQDVIEILLQEGITLDSMHVVHVVQGGDINVLIKVVEHLKCHNKWNPHKELHMADKLLFIPSLFLGNIKTLVQVEIPCSRALYITYCKDRFDMADYLLKNDAKVSMEMFCSVTKYSSLKAVFQMIENLKVTSIWDPHCDHASEGLENAYCAQKYDVCELLICEGVSLSMKNIPGVVSSASYESIKKAIRHLKDTDSWDPTCDDASEALKNAYRTQKCDVCDLLILEGASISMKHFSGVAYSLSLEDVKRAIQHLKDTGSWDPKCNDASEVLESAYSVQKYDVCDLLVEDGVSLSMKLVPQLILRSLGYVKAAVKLLKDIDDWDPKCDYATEALANAYFHQKYDVCNLLVQEGVLLTMKHFHHVLSIVSVVRKAIQHLKDTDRWDPKCADASEALNKAYSAQKYDVCDLLILEGVSLSMKNLPDTVYSVSLKSLKKAIKHLKCTDRWDPKCNDASQALENAYSAQKYDVCDLLVEWGVSLSMKLVPQMILRSLDYVKTAVIQLKDVDGWDPKCDYASEALANAYRKQKYDVCDMLVQEGVFLTMQHFHHVLYKVTAVVEAIQHLKYTGIWDPKCADASDALESAYITQNYDVCDLLILEGVSLSMKSLPDMVYSASLESLRKVIQHLKDTDGWDPHCDDACKALVNACSQEKYNVFALLVHERVMLTMNNLPGLVVGLQISLESVKKTIQHLKETGIWDPKCDDASVALESAFNEQKYDVCHLLIQEGVSLKMKHLPGMLHSVSLESVKRAIQQLKDTDNWDSKCDDASKALQSAYSNQKYVVCDLLVQEGVQLTMMHLPGVLYSTSFESVKRAIQHLKDTNSWDPKCDDALKTLEIAYTQHKYDVCDLLFQEGISLSMKHLPRLLQIVSLVVGKKVILHLKETKSWDPKCAEASKALENAYREKEYDVCHHLIEEGVIFTMKNLHDLLMSYSVSLGSVKKVIRLLKDTLNWDPKCDHVSKALENAYSHQMYDVCDLLVQEGVILTMNHMPKVILRSLDNVKMAVKQLKDTNGWDPKCDDASKALAEAYREKKYDVCDLLIQEGISLTMKNLPDAVGGLEIPLEAVKKAVQHLKDTDNWDPKCDDASKALAEAYEEKKYDVCDLLIQEGVSLTMKNLPDAVGGLEILLDAFKKAVQHLKDTNNWDSKCNDASKALVEAYREKKYDVCDLLIQVGVSLTMKNLPDAVGGLEISLKAVKKAVQHLKDTDNWDPKCDDASKALAEAYGEKKYDVCDLLIQEGVSLTMKSLPDSVGGLEISLEAVKKAVQHLKDTINWDPKCNDASKALAEAYREGKYDVCDLLIQEGVSLTMKNLPDAVGGLEIPLEAVKKAVQHLKDTNNWDPKCNDASKALSKTYREKKYDVCDLLIQEGVSLTMKCLPDAVGGLEISLEAVKKAVQHLKDTINWDPKCNDASKALAEAYREMKYDVCDLLIQEGVSLTMKNLQDAVGGLEIPLEAVKKAVQHLKDTNNWDPKCNDASKALSKTYREKKYDVCDLLIQEGVSLTMKNLPDAVGGLEISLKAVKKAVQHLKDTDNWDPKCDDASKALAEAYGEKKYDVCDLLIQEGVSLTMKNLPDAVGGLEISLEAVKKAVQHLKDTNNWDPKCNDASKALAEAYRERKYDVCDLLIQEGVSLTMKNLPDAVGGLEILLEAVKKAVQHLKDTNSWDSKCDDASKVLAEAYREKKYDVCDLLIQEGVSLTMKNLPDAVGGLEISLKAVKKAVQHLKDTDNWDPKCNDASKALAEAYGEKKYDVCDLLIQEGVSLTMKNLPDAAGGLEISVKPDKKAVQHLKDNDNWDPKCDDASKALEEAYGEKKCDLSIQEGVSLTMKNLPDLVRRLEIALAKCKDG